MALVSLSSARRAAPTARDLERLLVEARDIQRRVSLLHGEPPADDAGGAEAARRLRRAARRMVRDLSRRERPGADAAGARADRARRAGRIISATAAARATIAPSSPSEVARLGIGEACATYLPTLVPGIAASALHAFMRLAYGVHARRPGGGRRGARLLGGDLSAALPGDRRAADHRRSGRGAGAA